MVYMVTDGKQHYAIKRIIDDKRTLNREVEIMEKLNHPFIVMMNNCIQSSTEVFKNTLTKAFWRNTNWFGHGIYANNISENNKRLCKE